MPTNQFYPQLAYINAITNAQQAVVTFTADHDFTIGQVISFRVTPDFGMFQINYRHGTVQETTSDTVTVNIDTSDWDAFDYSALNTAGTTPPTVNILDAFDNRRV